MLGPKITAKKRVYHSRVYIATVKNFLVKSDLDLYQKT